MDQREIGVLPGIDYSAVSIGRKRLLMMMDEGPELKSLFANVTDRIRQG